MAHILIIDNNLDYARSLASATSSPIEPLVPTGMDLLEVSDRLKEVQNEGVESVYVSAEVTFREHPRRCDYGGVELLKHIRLTSELGQIRLLPIVLAIWRKLEEYLRLRAENIVLCSPGVFTIRHPLDGNILSTRLQEISRFGSFQSMFDAVREYFPITNQDRAASEHDYRNRIGAARLSKELFGVNPENEVLTGDFENFRKTTLWIKKMEFHQEAAAHSTFHLVPSDIQVKVRASCADSRVLLIDDEHRKGWSYAICKALVKDDVPKNQFQAQSHLIDIANGSFRCIDSFEAGLDYFIEHKKVLDNSLIKWSKSHNRLMQYRQEKRKLELELPIKLNQLKEKKAAIQRNIETIRKRVEEAAHGEREAELQSQEKKSTFLLTYQDVENLLKNPAAVIELSEVIKVQDNHNRLVREYITASDELKSIEDQLTSVETELAHLQETQTILAQNLEHAEGDYQKNNEDLISCFQPDLIFLDLRLDPLIDRNRIISETSGIKLLNEIKNYDPSIPVIILTASQKALSHVEALAYGAEGYWMKDISSGSELVAIVIQLLSNIGLRRRAWRKIRQIESKTVIRRYRVQRDGTVQEQLINDVGELHKIKAILRECFALMIGKESEVAQSITKLEPYDEIALRIGRIQEFSIYFPDDFKKDEKVIWSELRKQGLLTKEDDKIREFRNAAAHFYSKRFSSLSTVGSPVSPQQVLESFEYTLDSLLSP